MADQTVIAVLWKLNLGGGEVDVKDIIQFTCDKDLMQPDMGMVVLRNEKHQYVSKAKIGDPFEIRSSSPSNPGSSPALLFKGKIAGVEPQYKGGGESRVTIRAFCSLHEKLAGKKSRTFQDKTDEQIIKEVLGDIEFDGPRFPNKHVTQDNMSDLDFARLRASRIGCYIWSENGKIMVKRPDLASDSGVAFDVYSNANNAAHKMKSFAPRLTGAQILKSCEVRGWDPEKKQAIIKRVQAQASKLGNTKAADAAGTQAADVTFTCDQPIWSEEEAKALAEARLQEHNLGYMAAEAEAFGNAEYLPGKVIKIAVNSQAADKFDGKYFVTGTSHKYHHGTHTNPDGGYTTVFRLARDAEVQ